MLGRENSKYARVNGFLLDKSIKISISQDSYDNFGFRPQFRHQDTIYSGFLVIIYILCVFLINLLKDRLRLNSEDFCQTAGTKNIKSMFIGFFVESQMVSASNVEPIIIGFLGVKCKKDMALPENSPSVKITTSLI